MGKKSTLEKTENFITRAIKIHGDKYDYTNTKYIYALEKAEIICKIHGSFWQIPASHLLGHGCHQCKVANQTLNTDIFIEMSRKIHGDKYDYGKTNYIFNKQDVIIICSIHGEFKQAPRSHLKGSGCIKCAFENLKIGKDDFILRSNEMHSHKYNYDKVVYITNKIPVIIHCYLHGDFKQSPNDHLTGANCSKCSREEANKKLTLTAEEFVEAAHKTHNNFYIYDKVDYKHSHLYVVITCPIHGDFSQIPGNHLAGNGCSKCRSTRSKAGNKWLTSLGIPDDDAHREVKLLIDNRRFKADGFIPETNTICEFYGDYFHGNPDVFDPNEKSGLGDKTYGELYAATMERERIIKEAGYNIISIWENDWKKEQK